MGWQPGREAAEKGRVTSRTHLQRAVISVSRARTDLPLVLLDALLVSSAYLAVLFLRFDGQVTPVYWSRFAAFIPIAVLVHLLSNASWGLYRQMWRHASIVEARQVLLADAVALAVLIPVYFTVDRSRVPLSVIVLGAMMATLLVGGMRFQSRLFAIRKHAETTATPGMRVAVVGAGEAGASIVREMLRTPSAGMIPVALFDDDPRKQRHALLGVPVEGGVDSLPEICQEIGVHRVLLAIPSAGRDLVRRVAAAAEQADLPMQVVPPLSEVISGRVSLRDVRNVGIEDLLGRQQVKTDLEEVRRLLAGKRIMITGGGGSIGAEIARQISAFDPALLVIVDNDETHLHDAAARVDGPVESVLCDIRSFRPLIRVFEQYRPEVLFHAAALKHVPVLEDYPCQAIETNVVGTSLIMQAAETVGTELTVFISTDKAVRPSSVMGATKWLGEQIVLRGGRADHRRCAVRFGNVLGSRGSVIPTFERQIAAGGPVTVTHPDMTRYFMSIEEAVQLVLQAASFAGGGEVFMLEMGQPVRIYELAERMIRLSGYAVSSEVEIELVGIRPGEKLEEELLAPDEVCEPTSHESIVRLEPVLVPGNLLDGSLAYLAGVADRQDDAAARSIVDLANSVLISADDDVVLDLTAAEWSSTWNPSSI
jgi:FlaA1/EpsC-like NDP-sugar epimerase